MNPISPIAIGKTIQDRRIALNWSVAYASGKAGIAPITWQKHEAGEFDSFNLLARETQRLIAEAMRCDVDTLRLAGDLGPVPEDLVRAGVAKGRPVGSKSPYPIRSPRASGGIPEVHLAIGGTEPIVVTGEDARALLRVLMRTSNAQIRASVTEAMIESL